jgi:hypothetical protein
VRIITAFIENHFKGFDPLLRHQPSLACVASAQATAGKPLKAVRRSGEAAKVDLNRRVRSLATTRELRLAGQNSFEAE